MNQILRTAFTNFPTTSTTGRHLEFKRDFNYHTAFQANYVIVHKVYYYRDARVLLGNTPLVKFTRNYIRTGEAYFPYPYV